MRGLIRTLDAARPVATSIAIEGDRIASLDEPAAGPDLGGFCVVPGFTDSHVHFPSWALSRSELDLSRASSPQEAAALAAAAAPGICGWVRGRGWRSEAWPEQPTREHLRDVAAPAAFWAADTHTVWLNDAALRRAAPVIGTGHADGIVRETPAFALREALLLPSAEETVAAVRAALPVAHAAGVCAIHDKDGGAGAPAAFAALRAAGELMRVHQSVPAAAVAGGARGDYAKAFLDGTLGSDTACWLGREGGAVITSRPAFEELVREAAALGMPMAVHAIGDAAVRDALDAFEATRAAWAPRGLRHRIEHCQWVDPADLPRFAALGVTASVQFAFAPTDRDLADARGLGDRPGAYPWASLHRAGAVVVNGSDAPVEALDPLAGMRADVLRTRGDREAWHPEEAVTPEQALVAATRAPAWLAGDDERRGTLAPGMLPDLVVLSADPLVAPLDEVEVVATMVGGEWVHGGL
ncbi:MAG: amidohydrolase [Solirubrobacteraceae bacterium]